MQATGRSSSISSGARCFSRSGSAFLSSHRASERSWTSSPRAGPMPRSRRPSGYRPGPSGGTWRTSSRSWVCTRAPPRPRSSANDVSRFGTADVCSDPTAGVGMRAQRLVCRALRRRCRVSDFRAPIERGSTLPCERLSKMRLRGDLDASRFQLDERGLVQIGRLNSEADPAGQLAAAFDELLLGGLRLFLRLPKQDSLGPSVLFVVEGYVAGEAVVLAQHRDHGLADCLNSAFALPGSAPENEISRA